MVRAFGGRVAGRGAALVVAMCTLLMLLLAGASAARLALQGELAARNERDRHIAFHAAEGALMDAEQDIEGGPGTSGRGAAFAPDSAAGFVAGCGGGAQLGLCLSAPDGEPPVWQRVDLSDADEETGKTVPYGRFTGARMQTGDGFLPFRRPRYLIELVPYAAPNADADPDPAQDPKPDPDPVAAPVAAAPHYLYRVTAIGFGSRAHTEVVLQTFYRKSSGEGGAK